MTELWLPLLLLLTGRCKASRWDVNNTIHPQQSVEVNGSDKSDGRCGDKPIYGGFWTFKSLLDAQLFRLPTLGSARAAFAGSCTERSQWTCVNVVCVPPEDRLFWEITHSVDLKKKTVPPSDCYSTSEHLKNKNIFIFYIYSCTVLNYNFEVLVLYTSTPLHFRGEYCVVLLSGQDLYHIYCMWAGEIYPIITSLFHARYKNISWPTRRVHGLTMGSCTHVTKRKKCLACP